MAEKDLDPKAKTSGGSSDARGPDQTEDEPSASSQRLNRAEDPPISSGVTVKREQRGKAAWAAPLARLDKAWTGLDAYLCFAILMAEILTLVFWIAMKALSSSGHGGSGMVFRSMLVGIAAGVATHLATRKHQKHDLYTTIATVTGLVVGCFLGDTGVAYFGNLLAWMQNASILVFFGGASDVAKRLTLWLALLGASVATGQGKHINIDVAMRLLSPKRRIPLAVFGWLTAAVVCITAAWGFFDYVAVADYRVATSVPCPSNANADANRSCQMPAGQEIGIVWEASMRDFFLARRQLSLDLRTFPKIISGTPYNETLTPKEWNAWLRQSDWTAHFAVDDVRAMELPEDGSAGEWRLPAVTAVPGGTEQISTLLIRELNFVFAVGLLFIALRFVLRSVLAIAGWVGVDPDEAHNNKALAHAHEAQETQEAAP
ncbi:MAG: TRAP transporter small permease [Polyangiaceae bacterium]|nr:TRAP transporter small permease [Polyangiaceae bacterium]